ncbi:MAG: FHA domain-containing protein [Microbacteriaceae bacterium]
MSEYTPGPWFAAVAPGGAVVLPSTAGAEHARASWAAVRAGGGLGSVLETLTGAFGTSLAALPPFAVVMREGDELRIAVRGPLTVRAAGVSVHGAGVTTWNEQLVRGGGAVTIDTEDAGDDAAGTLPFADGIVMVARLVVDVVDAQGAAASIGQGAPAPARTTAAEPERATAPEPEPEAEPALEAAQEAAATREPDAAPDPEAAREPETAPEPKAGPAPESRMPPQSEPEAQPEPAPEAEPEPEPEPDSESLAPEPAADPTPIAVEALGPDDDEWGATVVKAATDPAFRRPSAAGAAAANLAGFPPPTGAPVATAPGLISAVPGGTGHRPGDHDGQTISVAQSRAMRAAGQLPPQPGTAAPPPPAPAPPVSTARIVLSTGRTVQLDRTVVIGRRPSSTRTTGGMLPHLITVDSPEQDISRSHVEIRLEGDAVVVVDLHTTNGTMLRRAGSEPTQLHPGEATVVVSGDVLELGDGVSVTFEGIA